MYCYLPCTSCAPLSRGGNIHPRTQHPVPEQGITAWEDKMLETEAQVCGEEPRNNRYSQLTCKNLANHPKPQCFWIKYYPVGLKRHRKRCPIPCGQLECWLQAFKKMKQYIHRKCSNHTCSISFSSGLHLFVQHVSNSAFLTKFVRNICKYKASICR